MRTFIFIVDFGYGHSPKEVCVVGDNEKAAHAECWESLTSGEQDNAESIELVDVAPINP